MSDSAAAVQVDGVHKTFHIPREHVHTLKERVLHPFRRPGVMELKALQDVSFAVEPGQFYGIVGRNGSGKSTLLKCMAGIYATDRGRIYVDGRLSTFIELGVGFNVDLPARDNVLLNATMLGLSPREARRRFDKVIDFAELGEFTDLKLKNYSSGMLVRLAFAVMIQVDADVLLIDEVLAVGDASFAQKCFDEFGRLRRRGATVVLVTHDMSSVQRFCDQAMLLERGKVVEIGDPKGVGDSYIELNFGRGARESQRSDGDEERLGDGRARIVDAWFEDERGERADVLPVGCPASYVMRVVFAADVLDPAFTVALETDAGAVVLAADEGVRHPTGPFSAGEEVTVRFSFTAGLAPDSYVVTTGVSDGGGLRPLDRIVGGRRVTITGQRTSSGLLQLPFDTAIEQRVRGGDPRAGVPVE